MRKLLLLVIGQLFLLSGILAKIEPYGKVTDENGSPIQNVSVLSRILK
jgi:hypothetical protein